MGSNRLGAWEVLGELARGGQGVILRARHAAHGTPAAIKLLLRVEQKTVLRFKQEAAVLLRLNHPNLVRVLEVGEREGAPFLAMELVSGQSLADLVREGGPLPPRSSVSHWAHGVALLAAGDAAGAVAACTSSIEAWPRPARALATRAAAHEALGRRAEARADLDRAVELDVRVDARLARAGLRERTGDGPGAAADLREALLRLGPKDPRRAATAAALARLARP